MAPIRLGRYELLHKLASGGMGEVFLARQWGEDGFFRDIVVKRLFRNYGEDERVLRMFQFEAHLLAELAHPNVPQVFDLGCIDGEWYLAMEYVDGFSIADLCRAGARAQHAMPVGVALGIVLQLCEALHHAHERRDRGGRPLRIVHRDVTPQNVMVTRDGVVKLLDFGVAQTAARKETQSGTLKGTLSYMAPEQVRARALDKRADVFAVGVMLYELTTGTRLYRGTDIEVMTGIVERDAPPPSTRWSDYPQSLEEIVLAALARDRAQRIPSAAHLAHRLEEFAMRAGLQVGPRAVARYVTAVYPFEHARDESLGRVAEASVEFAPPGAGPDWSDATSEDAFKPDAELEQLPNEAREERTDDTAVPEPLRLPAEYVDAVDSQLTSTDPAIELPSDDLEVLEDDPASPERSVVETRAGIRGRAPLTFDDDSADKPVVLLNQPKRRRAAPEEARYVEALERRLAGDREDDGEPGGKR